MGQDNNLPPPQSAAAKRKPDGMEDEDMQATKSNKLPNEGAYQEMSEVARGLEILGFHEQAVDWLMSNEKKVTQYINEIRRIARIHG